MQLKYYKRYCKDIENVENFEKAAAENFNGWQLHHRLETHNSDGERRVVDITAIELITLGMYYNRPADELIFMTTKEHRQLHMKDKTGYWKDKINPMYGKHHSEETKKKISEAAKQKPSNIKGRHWYNNGEINKRCYECPEGFVPGILK